MQDKRSFANGNGQSIGNGSGASGNDVTQKDWQLILARSTAEHWWLRV